MSGLITKGLSASSFVIGLAISFAALKVRLELKTLSERINVKSENKA